MNLKLVRFRILFLFCFMAGLNSCKGLSNSNITADNNSTTPGKGNAKIVRNQGVKNGNIHCAILDKSGKLWFGTTGEGIYVYDGENFTQFTAKDGLNSNYIAAILEDNAGNIWIGTNAGLCRYDGKKFTNISLGVFNGKQINPYKSTNDPNNNLPAKLAVWSIMQDKSGKIWFGTFDAGVYCYDGKSFSHFLHQDSVVNKSKLRLGAVNSILEDKAGNIWFATWFDGLCRYDGEEIVSFKPNNEVWYAAILEDKDGKIWIGRRTKGLLVYDRKGFTNIVQGGTLDSCGVSPILQDKAGNIWFGSIHSNMSLRETLGGLWKYDGKSFKNFTAKDGLINNNIWSAIEDKEGKLWFGALEFGLFSYDGKTFTNYTE